MKHCYIRMSESEYWYKDGRYLEVILTEARDSDNGIPMCWLGGEDDWELSYTGTDAVDKFNALTDVSGDVEFKYILQLGFTQYG